MKIRRIFLAFVIFTILMTGCIEPKTEQPTALVERSTATLEMDGPSPPPPTTHAATLVSTESIEDIVGQLQGLPIDQFFEEAYRLILLRNQEFVIELGYQEFEVEAGSLTNVSPEFTQETKKLLLNLIDLLHTYEFDSLEETEQISYMVFEWYLEDEIEGLEFIEFSYPVTSFSIRSVPQLSIMFFTDTYPLFNSEDAEGYVLSLRALDDKMDQVIECLQYNRNLGVVPPKFILHNARNSIKDQLGYTAQSSPLYLHFNAQVNEIDTMDQNLKDELSGEILTILMDEVFPTFDRLDVVLRELGEEASTDIGLTQFDHGADYYQYSLDHFTTTNLSADVIHQMGLIELERIKQEMQQTFLDLGYPEDLDIPSLYNQMIQDSGTLRGNAIANEYRTILAAADASLDAYFDLRPSTPLEVVGGEEGDFYSPGALDGRRPGQFYARSVGIEPIYKLKTIAYHEGIPGHHYQISIAQGLDLPLFRKVIIFDGYAEGWALYGEYLAWELGWYSDDPYGNLGRLQYEALRASRMIVDTGIHTKGWSYDESVDFLIENTGIVEGFARYEVERYIAFPGQAPAYTVGKLKIQELRKQAMDSFGEDFDIREFHNIVLQNGSMPLEILQIVVENWIAQKSTN
jgi:uncharacterized protein (DUF885 family)